MQIGNEGDPGLRALLSGKEGGDLVLPAAMRQRLTITSVASVPRFNIEAGIAYLLMRHARFDILPVPDNSDTHTYSALVEKGDSLDKIARRCGTIIENLNANNNGTVSEARTSAAISKERAEKGHRWMERDYPREYRQSL